MDLVIKINIFVFNVIKLTTMTKSSKGIILRPFAATYIDSVLMINVASPQIVR